MLMSEEDDNMSNNYGHHEEEEYILKEQDIKEDYVDLMNKSLDTGYCIRSMLSKRTPQDGLLRNELS